MSDTLELDRVKVYLTERSRQAPFDQEIAWENFFLKYDPMIRTAVTKYDGRRTDFDDIVQEVWKTLIQELPKLHYEPARGPLRSWVTAVARHTAIRQIRRLSSARSRTLAPALAAALHDPTADQSELIDRIWQR
jgi:RNA polymerase sigma factor (sigma-70 family)